MTLGLPARIDLIEWLRLRKRMSRGRARAIILKGFVKSESHTLGIREVEVMPGSKMKFVDPLVPASLRDSIYVATPEEVGL